MPKGGALSGAMGGLGGITSGGGMLSSFNNFKPNQGGTPYGPSSAPGMDNKNGGAMGFSNRMNQFMNPNMNGSRSGGINNTGMMNGFSNMNHGGMGGASLWNPYSGGMNQGSNEKGVANAYQTLLGRQMRPDEYSNWSDNNNYFNEIANSPEALARQPYSQGSQMQPQLSDIMYAQPYRAMMGGNVGLQPMQQNNPYAMNIGSILQMLGNGPNRSFNV